MPEAFVQNRLFVGRDIARRLRMRTAWAVILWVAVIVIGASIAGVLMLAGQHIAIDAPPFHAQIDPVLPPELGRVLVVAALAVVVLPVLERRASWRTLLVVAPANAAGFGVVLASMRGWEQVVAPVRQHREYLAVLPRVTDVGVFLETYSSRLASYPVHVQGHPPGPVLLALGLRAVGLDAAGWFAGALVVGGALMVPAALVVVREVAGEPWARRAMPFLVIGPAAVWLVTSADGLFAGVSAIGVALVVLATGGRGRRRDGLALAGGTVLGVAAFLSYGLVLIAMIPLVIAWRRRTARPIALAAGGALVVVVAFGEAGFWWFDGLAATRQQYLVGIASQRPYLAFVFIDVAAFALVLGPATAAGLAHLRDRRMWVVVGAGLATVTLALLSGMAKGEVERIWLPFAPWVLVAAAATLPGPNARERGCDAGITAQARFSGDRHLVGWLAVQAGVAILIESLIRTPW